MSKRTETVELPGREYESVVNFSIVDESTDTFEHVVLLITRSSKKSNDTAVLARLFLSKRERAQLARLFT